MSAHGEPPSVAARIAQNPQVGARNQESGRTEAGRSESGMSSPVVIRQALLTFVVAGGGFAGAELAGGLNDFTRGMLADYPNIPPEELRIVLVHSRDRILPELSAPLAAYALDRMAARGVTFKLNTRVPCTALLPAVIPSVTVDAPEETTRHETAGSGLLHVV